MQSSLQIYAGPTALASIRANGIHPEQFKVMVGASGGPKWFVLFGLDRYLFGDFLPRRRDALYTLGSSAGAWRMCCFATADPVAAIERLAKLYSEEQYSDRPTTREITEKAELMLTGTLGPSGAAEIAANKTIHTTIIADRSRGLGSSRRKGLQAASLGAAALANIISRRSLSLFFERTLFSTLGAASPWSGEDDLRTASVQITEDNIVPAMMATGSIPYVLDGVRDIPGARPGLYWDGGITDYHLDMDYHAGEALVLYPHFSSAVIPGWFDKPLSWRRAQEANLDRVVMITPSPSFVAGLPNGKIPDRNDFENLSAEERVRCWRLVLAASERMADDFAALVEHGTGLEQILPIAQRSR
jgi:hypothetical protein